MKKRFITLLTGMLTAVALTGCAGAGKDTSDTVKWINNTYAVLTYANGGDINEIGGYKKNPTNEAAVKGGLESSWDVTDRQTADETLDWILTEGHRANFRDEMSSMEEDGLLEKTDDEMLNTLLSFGFTDAEAACYLATAHAYMEKGEEAIDAWDYCRALQLLGWYYVAGYYTEQETLDKSLEIAEQLRRTYGSWDELMESYLAGYNYWAEDDPDDPESGTAARRAVYAELKGSEDNPYTLDWYTELENTWAE